MGCSNCVVEYRSYSAFCCEHPCANMQTAVEQKRLKRSYDAYPCADGRPLKAIILTSDCKFFSEPRQIRQLKLIKVDPLFFRTRVGAKLYVGTRCTKNRLKNRSNLYCCYTIILLVPNLSPQVDRVSPIVFWESQKARRHACWVLSAKGCSVKGKFHNF